ncbi:MAG: membrane protein insertion efficiency factor YidD [candidate division WOR-3 bacterium]
MICVIRFYQFTLGSLLPRVCRFEPSCSNYAIEALSRYGILKGTLLSILRVLRCNPFSPGGYDPVVKDSKER